MTKLLIFGLIVEELQKEFILSCNVALYDLKFAAQNKSDAVRRLALLENNRTSRLVGNWRKVEYELGTQRLGKLLQVRYTLQKIHHALLPLLVHSLQQLLVLLLLDCH